MPNNTNEAQHINLAAALLAIQAEAVKLQKNAINPHFKNKYISLDSLMGQVLPVLNANEVVLLQAPELGEGNLPCLTTVLIHAPSGDRMTHTMPLVLERDNPQGQGSAITYARRYSLMAVLGLVADEDDDGEKATLAERDLTYKGDITRARPPAF